MLLPCHAILKLKSMFHFSSLRSCFGPLLVTVLLLFGVEPTHAQGMNGFFPGKGNATMAISHTFESYDEYWVGTESISDPTLGEVETGSVSLYADVGLLEDLAINANFAYVDVSSSGSAPVSDNGLQDRTFLLRYRFLQLEGSGLEHVFVAGVGLRAPMAPYEPNRVVALGDETHDALFRFIYQLQFGVLDGGYVSGEFGYDLREDDTPEQTSVYGEAGVTIGRFSPSLAIYRNWADGGFDIGDPGFRFPELDSEYFRWGGKLYYRVSSSFGKASGMSTSLVLNL
jgi:hypothetical protein